MVVLGRGNLLKFCLNSSDIYSSITDEILIKCYQLAAAHGETEIIELLKSKLQELLKSAIENGNISSTKAILEHLRSEYAELCLNDEFMIAVNCGQLELVQFFLEIGVHISEQVKFQAAENARTRGFLQIVDVLYPDRPKY